MAVTFEQARQAVQAQWPDYDVATYGFEGDSDWFLVLLPPRAGGRVPAVSKATGALRWIHSYSPEYTEQQPVQIDR